MLHKFMVREIAPNLTNKINALFSCNMNFCIALACPSNCGTVARGTVFNYISAPSITLGEFSLKYLESLNN